MTDVDALIAHLKSLPDRPARYTWLDGLDRTDRNAILNRLPAPDRQRYRAHEEKVRRDSKKAAATADHETRRAAALAGRATEIPDMIEALYTVMPKLTEAQRDWVEKIDQTAAASRRDGFTTRQAAVIQDLYRKQFRSPKR